MLAYLLIFAFLAALAFLALLCIDNFFNPFPLTQRYVAFLIYCIISSCILAAAMTISIYRSLNP